MRASEFITELKFMGSTCTKDCTGHAAGFKWGKDHNIRNPQDCTSHSISFNNGCALAAINHQARGTARDATGRFISIPKRPKKASK